MGNDAKRIIGGMIRRLRETSGLSQDKLAARSGITYQYLSALENGKENFTIAVLEAIAASLGMDLPDLVGRAYGETTPPPTVESKFFISRAVLPPGLNIQHIEAALNETHRVVRLINVSLKRVSGRPLSSYIQGNNFSGIVSNILCDSFSRLTPYKHNHDQRYPDLICKADRKGAVGLEVKSTIRPGKGGESHNGHSGWHVIACFNLNKDSGDVCFVHVMFADLIGHEKPDADWKYVGSKVNENTGSQRTETYTTTSIGTAKLRHGTAYLDTNAVNIARWRTPSLPVVSAHSPFVKAVQGKI